MNVNNEIKHMSEYLSEIWSVDQKEVFSFIKNFYKTLSEDSGYKNYLGDSPDYMYLIRDVMKNREAQLENRFYTMIDGLSVLCSNLICHSNQDQKGLSFDNMYKKCLSSLDKNEKECLKNAKIKGWNKEHSLELLESSGFNLSKYKEYKGLIFKQSSYYEFKEAINPLIILYRKERHSYKLDDLLREACLVQLIQIKAHENQLIFKQDMENLVANFNEINKDNISKAIYAPDLEKELTSEVAKNVLNNIEKKIGKELVGSKDDFDKFLNELSIEKEKKPVNEEELVKENSKKMLQQLYQSLGKKNKP